MRDAHDPRLITLAPAVLGLRSSIYQYTLKEKDEKSH